MEERGYVLGSREIYIFVIGEGGYGDGDAGVLSEGLLDSDVPLFFQLAAEVGENGYRLVAGGEEFINGAGDSGVGFAILGMEGAGFDGRRV